MIPNITLIDDEDEIPNESDWETEYNYNELDEVDCFACNGTGEGRSSDTTCPYCKGLGVIKK